MESVGNIGASLQLLSSKIFPIHSPSSNIQDSLHNMVLILTKL